MKKGIALSIFVSVCTAVFLGNAAVAQVSEEVRLEIEFVAITES